MNIGWRTKYILALSEDFLIHRWKLSGTMGLAHGFNLSNKPPKLVWRGNSFDIQCGCRGLFIVATIISAYNEHKETQVRKTDRIFCLALGGFKK